MLNEINQIKALLMLILSETLSPSADELISSALATDIVNINDVTDAFLILNEDGLIEVKDSGKMCLLTEKGRMILPELSAFLNAGIKNDALSKALRFYNAEKSGTEYSSRVEKSGDGYVLVCVQTEHKKESCAVRLYFESENEALLAKNNFEKRPDAVMNAVKAAVTGEVGYLI